MKAIKTLYEKRDAIKDTDYDLDKIQKLYKFMLDNLTKKLGLISSVKSKKGGEDRDKHVYKINDSVKEKYDRLIEIMNPKSDLVYSLEDDE
jgi:DNA-binding PadR family transcriptional regulator